VFSPLGRQVRPRQSNTKSCAAPQDGYRLARPARLCGDLHSCAPRDSLRDSFRKNWFGAMWDCLSKKRKVDLVLCQTAPILSSGKGQGYPLLGVAGFRLRNTLLLQSLT
jgi:hypothetical protein